MSCHGCASSFGFFNKVRGCANCGFSYCSKCLRYKALVPKHASELSVCKQCYTSIMNGEEKSNLRKEQYSPPAAFLRRLESLENPAKPPITVYHHDQRMEQLRTGLTPTDREIVDRLEKLREERKKEREKEPAPSEDEILRRLAALKGEDADRAVAVAKKKVNLLPDTRSDEEKTNDLIKQLLEEQILSAKQISPEDMIAQRLAKLKGMDEPSKSKKSIMKGLSSTSAVVKSEKSDVLRVDLDTLPTDKLQALLHEAKIELKDAHEHLSVRRAHEQSVNKEDDGSSSDEEALATAAVDKLVKEAALEMKTKGFPGKDGNSSPDIKEEEDSEELPWCGICNEDASLRCLGCDGELYCNRCFAEGHEGWDLTAHKTVPYQGKRT